MTVFNKIVVTLLLLAVIPIITIGLIVPREAVELLAGGLDDLESQMDPSVSGVWLLLRVVLAVVINGVLVVLLYLQVRRAAAFGVPVQQVEGGEAEIAVNGIVAQLEYHIDPLPGVLDVKPTVIPRRRGVEVALEIEMTADVNLPANVEQISAATRRVIEGELGLKLKGKPKLKLRTIPFPEPMARAGVSGPAVGVLAEKTVDREPARFDKELLKQADLEDEAHLGDIDEQGSAELTR